ncbi:adenine deaminase [Clostridium botulinum]|uniref:adenine deaminase n=1 Tax=Clostridium botulinum TaxID=1491 RepID=UPI001969AF3C|nr:adenine deaminase C-terminal domain-containing protein [Clostridium botulinum]MBN3395078.1 adenine deaminase [Clostridium botulinum]
MFNKFDTKPLWEVSKTLSSVAQGFEPADMVIINSKLINVCTREVIENTDVAISCGRIALVGDAKHCIGENTEVIDAKGQYIAPGFLDGHIHVESSMLSVSEYARSVVPHGTVGIYMDPHEICNVLGLNGVRYMIEDGKGTPLKNMVTTPSCVPAVPGFEDTGAAVGPEDVRETMKWDEIVGLGEMMNFPGILYSTDHAHGVVGETLKASKTVTGHYSLPETGKGLNGYIASGVRCCHESTRAEDALAKMRLGMYAMFREGSAWHDLKEVSKAITENKVDSRFAVLISDDTHPHTLLKDGVLTTSIAKYDYPEDAMHSMHIKDKITPDSFNIMAPNKEKITARVIEIIPERVGTYERHIELKVKDDKVQCDSSKDVLKAVVFERHHETGKAGYGFVKGFGIKRGAMAATVAHDAHNLLVIGTNDEDMALAANTLIECGGGMVAVQDGKVLGLVPLPIAGLMSNKPLEEMAEMVEKLDSAWKEIGCDIVSPFMTMALIPLACLPELRLTNRGLVDCNKFEFVSLFVEE